VTTYHRGIATPHYSCRRQCTVLAPACRQPQLGMCCVQGVMSSVGSIYMSLFPAYPLTLPPGIEVDAPPSPLNPKP
jgi:hypothetical protein